MLPAATLRILIIDDDPADREIYKNCLRLSAAWKFEFAETDSAATGIQRCREWHPDCILLDFNLPDQDGLETLDQLRAGSQRAPCAVVMLTAFGGEELAVRAMKAGVTDYLPKGRVAADTLPHTIANAVEKWRMQSQMEIQQTELQNSARRYQVLLEAIPQMVWMARADGSIEYANRRWFEYTGLALDQVQHLGWDHLLHPEDRERTLAAWARVNGRDGIFEIEHRLRRASDGTHRWHLVRATPLRNPSTGEIISWFGTCTEIEDQKRLDHDMLQRQKLESIGRLAGGVAHDFNNLLVAILGGASLAMETLPPLHPARKLLDGVVEAGDRAAQLTRQMLAYAGKSNLFVEPVDLPELVRDTCGLVRSSLPANLRLEVRAGDVPPIDTDKEQMRQVVMDLVMNAIEAVSPAGGVVAVCTDMVELDEDAAGQDGLASPLPSGRYAVLEVCDTGCGMDEEIRKKIFDPFFTTKSTGRGLGLAAVQGFVRSNRGRIEIETAPGQGTRFRILLPAALEPARRTCGAAGQPH
ncbi:MAG TPA: response regulator [Bryobacteraceae bacterium]|nr:response regulator [Bryobacteraceae bacterium]